jgi:hypothetical protein
VGRSSVSRCVWQSQECQLSDQGLPPKCISSHFLEDGSFSHLFRIGIFRIIKHDLEAHSLSFISVEAWLGGAPPPTKFKAMLPSNSHGQQGEASSAVESTTESLCGGRTALPAPIPSGRTKEPSARSASSSSTAHEAARARSASHAVR